MNRKALLCIAIACGSPAKTDTGRRDESGTASEDTHEPDSGESAPILPNGDRILVYYGAGGLGPQSTGEANFANFDARVKAETGYNTDHFETLPGDLSPYRLILLMAPGHDDPAASFPTSEAAQIEGARQTGTRIGLVLERAACTTQATADVLLTLQTDLHATGEAADINRIVDITEWATHPVTADVSQLRSREPCFSGGGQALAWDSLGHPLLSLATPDRAGDVLVLADPQILDDGAPWDDPVSHGVFAVNLARVERP